jgi:quercetin dioxygenase-like cupin family protein
MKLKLEERINYQDGAVVSREVLKNDSGTITIFAFDQGQGLSEHKTPFEALVYIVDGEAEITIAGKVHILHKGEMIHMPAKKLHALRANKRFKMLLTMLKV